MAEALAFLFLKQIIKWELSKLFFYFVKKNILYKYVFLSLPAFVEAIKKQNKNYAFVGFLLFFLSSVLRKGLIFLFISIKKGSG